MGVADVIPGVSGGTIAFLLGIYENFINSIKSFDYTFIKRILKFQFKEALDHVAWKYLGSILSGIGAAIILFAKIISWLLANKPVLIQSFFFGLILATVPIIASIVKQWNIVKIGLLIFATYGSYLLVNMIPIATPEGQLFVFACGALAISAMILPGISGAFILVLLGKYQFILDAINQRNFSIIIIFICGIAVGIVCFVRILSWLFNKYHDETVAILTGIVAGSLSKIWPWKETLLTIETHHGKIIPIKQANFLPSVINGEVLIAIGLIAFGFILAILLNKQDKKSISL